MSDRAKNVLKPFEENRAYMEERITSGIEANRKGLATLRFEDAEGNPVTGVHVEVRQKTHDFRFGANLFMLNELESEEKNKEYAKRFKETFNLATIPFFWRDMELQEGQFRFTKDSPRVYRRPVPDLCLEFCKENDIEPKLHCLNYDYWTPDWVPKDDVQMMKKYLDKYIAAIAERYGDLIPSMDVTNETLCDFGERASSFFREPDFVEWTFEHARKYLPSTKLIINEGKDFCWRDVCQGFKYNRSAYYMQIERALAKGASIDAIGMQYHMFFRAEDEVKNTAITYNPLNLYAVMDQYADFGKPYHISEITIPAYSNAQEDEDLQAEILKNLYSIWFSHPNMEAIVYWNLVDGYVWNAEPGDMTCGENYYHGALIRFDMTPKPAYKMLNKLIHETWNTKLSLDSGASNKIDMKGFYGEYDVTVTSEGKTVNTTLHLKKGAKNRFTLKV